MLMLICFVLVIEAPFASDYIEKDSMGAATAVYATMANLGKICGSYAML
jgi:hypothetical protein